MVLCTWLGLKYRIRESKSFYSRKRRSGYQRCLNFRVFCNGSSTKAHICLGAHYLKDPSVSNSKGLQKPFRRSFWSDYGISRLFRDCTKPRNRLCLESRSSCGRELSFYRILSVFRICAGARPSPGCTRVFSRSPPGLLGWEPATPWRLRPCSSRCRRRRGWSNAGSNSSFPFFSINV